LGLLKKAGGGRSLPKPVSAFPEDTGNLQGNSRDRIAREGPPSRGKAYKLDVSRNELAVQNREFKPVELGTHVELAGDFVAVMHRKVPALNVAIGTWHHAT
jgi:hypothetical protein